MEWYLVALSVATGLGLPIAVLSAAIAQGRVGAAALEGVARQPEAASRMQTMLILTLALIESLVIYALLIFFVLQGKLPGLTANQLIEASAARSAAVDTLP